MDDSAVAEASYCFTIETYAGVGSAGYSGDVGPATSAQLYNPWDVLVDSAGALYITDNGNNRVRKVDLSGTIATVAGGGTTGLGDGGPAASAQRSYSIGLAMDSAGNLYIADHYNSRVRKVYVSGTIATFAGSAMFGSLGDGGPATSAQLHWPYGLAFDSDGNLYIGDVENNRIRRVDTSGIITTVAGTGVSGYSGDGGPATLAELYWPSGVAVDHFGNLYIADGGNQRIRKVDASGIITTIAGTGVPGLLPATEDLQQLHSYATRTT